MGTWGYGSLENDTAADFLAEFREEPTIEVVVRPLLLINEAADNDKYLDASDCQRALAAAEIIAASRNQPPPAFPDDVYSLAIGLQLPRWDEYKVLMLITRRAVGIITEESELRELASESEAELAEWEQVQSNFQERLTFNSIYKA